MPGIEGGREGRPLAPKWAEVFSFTNPSAHNFSNVDVNVSILGSSSSSVHSLTISRRSFVSCSNPWMLFSCTRPSADNSSKDADKTQIFKRCFSCIQRYLYVDHDSNLHILSYSLEILIPTKHTRFNTNLCLRVIRLPFATMCLMRFRTHVKSSNSSL